MNAVDTNVYVYALDADEPIKQAKALELFDRLVLQSADTVLIWQVAGEFLSQLRRWESKGKLTSEEVQQTFRRFNAMFPLRTPSAVIVEYSFDLRARFSLSHWDSLLVAACKEAGVTTLYSEDMDSGTDYDGLTIVNPFARVWFTPLYSPPASCRLTRSGSVAGPGAVGKGTGAQLDSSGMKRQIARYVDDWS
jgi:predicted nucleic acid-binding protein